MIDISSIPILNYHKIDASPDIGITSRSPKDFEHDIKRILDLGYRFIQFKDIQSTKKSNDKLVILTFDDGYESVYSNALPIMENHAISACVFMPADFIGKYNDWDIQFGKYKYRHLDQHEIFSLIDKGWEIGAHGLSHQSLLHMSEDKAKYEIVTAKEKLQSMFNIDIDIFCYPFRKFNKKIIRLVRQAGYHYGIASQSLRILPQELQIFALPRINIYRYDSTETILERIMNTHRFRYRDWLIQRGASATILYQKFVKSRIAIKK